MKEQEENSNELLLGIDDAGRGPVLGPMVLAGCVMTRKIEEELKKAGIKDSKMLTPKQREHLAEEIKKKVISYHAKIITPIEIDSGFGEGLNLNQVEALAAASIINELIKNFTEKEKKEISIILDCPSNNKLGWLNQLTPYIKEKNLKIRCEHKADRDYPVVSAASIIAKTTRDAEIEKLKKKFSIDFGSGYPSDPMTKSFLKDNATNIKYKGLFRESWATWKEVALKNKDKQEKLFG
jgi:ribonuclease HII